MSFSRPYNMMFRLLVPIALAIAMYFVIFRLEEQEQAPEALPQKPRYRPFLNNYLLMSYLLLMVPSIFFVRNSTDQAFHTLISMWFTAFFHIGVYDLLLTAALPFLRKKISARVCAALWLLPNYLYLIILNQSYALARPLLVLNLPIGLVQAALVIWLVGFVVIFCKKIVEHLLFRKRLLQTAEPVADPEIQALWEQAHLSAGYPTRRYPLLTSAAAKTPLTIGLTGSSVKVILPKKTYSPEELSLIFHHELIHLGRDDCGTKLFLTFCTALCWINPLTWLAMRRSADDLELSCDESVLRDADMVTRRRYAELLLVTAGDDRGFTSNLSNSAKALRYRLRQVMAPKDRAVGAFLLAVVFFLLFVTCGFAAIPYTHTTGEEAVFQGAAVSDRELVSIYHHEQRDPAFQSAHLPVEHFDAMDLAALDSYISRLELRQLTGEYQYADNAEGVLTIVYEIDGGHAHAFIHIYSDDLITVEDLSDGRLRTCAYVPQSPLDRAALMSLLQTNETG